jgi:hypothetical protein
MSASSCRIGEIGCIGRRGEAGAGLCETVGAGVGLGEIEKLES